MRKSLWRLLFFLINGATAYATTAESRKLKIGVLASSFSLCIHKRVLSSKLESSHPTQPSKMSYNPLNYVVELSFYIVNKFSWWFIPDLFDIAVGSKFYHLYTVGLLMSYLIVLLLVHFTPNCLWLTVSVSLKWHKVIGLTFT